jgi:hypothetical protein
MQLVNLGMWAAVPKNLMGKWTDCAPGGPNRSIFWEKWTASPSFFLGTFVFGVLTGVRSKTVSSDQSSPADLRFPVTSKKCEFSRLIGGKRGGGFGKCTKMIPFWTDFAFFMKIKDF